MKIHFISKRFNAPRRMRLPGLLLILVACLFGTAFHSNAGIVSISETGADAGRFAIIEPTGSPNGSLFQEDAWAFTDRNHEYNGAAFDGAGTLSTSGANIIGLPAYLVGNPYIANANNHRDNASYRLTITVDIASHIYLLLDNRLGGPATDPPTLGSGGAGLMFWVADDGFVQVNTGLSPNGQPDYVGIDEGAGGDLGSSNPSARTHGTTVGPGVGLNNFYTVYRKTIPAGSIILKEQNGGGINMYGVVVVPAVTATAPTNIVVRSKDSSLVLTWNASGGTNYIIKRSETGGGPYTPVATNATTTYTDTSLVNGTTYYYVISALGAAGETANSIEVAGVPRSAPTGLVAVGGTNQVALSWNALDDASGYNVKRATNSGGPYSTIATGIGSTSYLDTTVGGGRTYYYVVSAILSGPVEGGDSDEASATTAPSTAPPLTASLWAAAAIRLDWGATDPVVTGYSIERSTNGVNFSPVATVPDSPRNYIDVGLSASSTYFYRIQATNTGGNSLYSNVASNTTPSGGWNVNFAAGAGNTAGEPVAPTPPGYLQDIGELLGDRGNGFTYGWSTPGGTNIVADGRYRRNAISPDLRYDTLLHLMKANVSDPSQSATWEIQIPNGFYWLRIVAGDPSNADPNTDRFQFRIEGVVLTRVHNAVATPPLAHWGEFTNTAIVSDGALTITSGPSALNNKICFVDIYPAEAVPIAIDQQPQPQTVTEFRPVSLSVTVSNMPFTPTTPFYGSEPISYQWYRNGEPVPGGTNSTLSFPLAQTTNSGDYVVVAMNYAGSVTSQVATLTVNEDMAPPEVVSVASLDGFSIGVCFNELLDLSPEFNTALDTINYFINGDQLAVTNVTMRPDGRSVRLALANQITGPFTVHVESVGDAAGNYTSGTDGSSTVLGFTALDVGLPTQPGSHYTCVSNVIEIVGGGADIWGASDQAYLAGLPVTGDFDVKVRVESLSLPATSGPGTIAKAALLARETLDAGSRGLHLSVNPPPPGRNQGEAGLRATAAGATAAWHTNSYTPAAIPDAWLRMTRVGNTFRGFRSTNGSDWIQFAQTNQSYPLTMMVGLGVTAHTNAASLVATGRFSNFMLMQPTADMRVAKVDNPDPISVGAQGASNLTYTITVTNQGPDNASIATVTDPLPAGTTFVSATPSQGTCANVGGTVTCNLGALAVGASATVTIVVTPTVGGVITNTATVAASALDPNGGNNSASAVTRVLAGTSLTSLTYSGGTFTMSFATANGLTYHVEYKNNLNDTNWIPLTTITGDGTVRSVTDPGPAQPMRFYRARVE